MNRSVNSRLMLTWTTDNAVTHDLMHCPFCTAASLHFVLCFALFLFPCTLPLFALHLYTGMDEEKEFAHAFPHMETRLGKVEHDHGRESAYLSRSCTMQKRLMMATPRRPNFLLSATITATTTTAPAKQKTLFYTFCRVASRRRRKSLISLFVSLFAFAHAKRTDPFDDAV